jgi:hypothetical protein
MRQIFFLLVIIVVGAAALAPIFIFLELEPQPLDFLVEWDGRRIMIPATYSLCASAALGLFYWGLKK